MWELDHKESWVAKNWCFWTVVLEKTLESPLDCKEIHPVHPKGNQSWIFTGRTDVEAESQILGHLMRRTDSLEKTLMLKETEGTRRRGDGGWGGWMVSPTWWTWVWVSSGIWWYTGKPGMLQSTGSQKSRKWLSDWTDWTERLEMIWTKSLVHYQVYIKVTHTKIDIILNNSQRIWHCLHHKNQHSIPGLNISKLCSILHS